MDKDRLNPSPDRSPGWPEGDDDVVNKYGTYEVQRTNGTENPYPMIAQGLSEREAGEQRDAARRWRRRGPQEPGKEP